MLYLYPKSENMKLSPYVKTLLEQKSGRGLRLSADCEYLALDIESKTGEHIGVNTLKRLLGFIDDEREPRISTLDIIARYLGFDSWDLLKVYDDKSNSSFGSSSDEICMKELTIGQQILISYLPDRELILCYKGKNHFNVIQSKNSKLIIDDDLEISHIVKGYPLIISDVKRGGNSLGSFTAGKIQGIDFKIL